jgi:hypothetical protein
MCYESVIKKKMEEKRKLTWVTGKQVVRVWEPSHM